LPLRVPARVRYHIDLGDYLQPFRLNGFAPCDSGPPISWRRAGEVVGCPRGPARTWLRGVTLKATEQPIDTGTAAGKCFLHMLGVFAEFETNLRRERQLEGTAKA